MVKTLVKGNTGKQSPNVGIPQALRFIPRQLETDADTRKSGRREVEVLPASTAIVNVYQLWRKKVKGGFADKKSAGISQSKKGKKRSSIYVEQSKPQKRYVSFLTGRYIDEQGNLIQMNGESDIEYEKNNRKQHQLAEAAKQAAEQEAINKTAENIKNIKEQAEFGKTVVAKSNAVSPKGLLLKRLVKDRIPYTDDNKRMELDRRYSGRSLGEPDDIIRINRAINNAIKEGRMGEVPPPIIAVGSRTNSPSTTMTVYVKNDLSESRRKKIIRSKTKRLVHGNKKKRVIMKGKGGKR
jgi:hypothetical protein